MNPLAVKLICTAVASGLYVLSHYFPDIKDHLLLLAGGLGAGAWAMYATPPSAKGDK